MEQGVLFIDAGHVFHAWQRFKFSRHVSYVMFEQWCFAQAGVAKAGLPSRFYDGIPRDAAKANKKHALLTKLRTLGFETYAGSLVERPLCDQCNRTRTSQKGVDTTIAIDMIECAWDNPEIDTFLIVTGDSDMIPIIERLMVRHRRRVILVYCTPGPLDRYDKLCRAPTQAIEVTRDDLRGLLLP